MERMRAHRGYRCAIMASMAAALTMTDLPQDAAAQTQQWSSREFQAGVNGIDEGVDVAYWKDGNNKEWVYITGYHTTASGASVFATFRYDANDPGPLATWTHRAFYPPDPLTATGINKAVAIEIDPETGDVYVTGESIDPNGLEGLDYVTIKYTSELAPHSDWTDLAHPNAERRWDNPTYSGTNSHDRPIALALGKNYDTTSFDPNIIGITGTSYVGASGGQDIATLLLNTKTGDEYTGWPSELGWGVGVRSFNLTVRPTPMTARSILTSIGNTAQNMTGPVSMRSSPGQRDR